MPDGGLLGGSFRIVGQVSDAITGNPIAGVTVKASPDMPPEVLSALPVTFATTKLRSFTLETKTVTNELGIYSIALTQRSPSSQYLSQFMPGITFTRGFLAGQTILRFSHPAYNDYSTSPVVFAVSQITLNVQLTPIGATAPTAPATGEPTPETPAPTPEAAVGGIGIGIGILLILAALAFLL